MQSRIMANRSSSSAYRSGENPAVNPGHSSVPGSHGIPPYQQQGPMRAHSQSGSSNAGTGRPAIYLIQSGGTSRAGSGRPAISLQNIFDEMRRLLEEQRKIRDYTRKMGQEIMKLGDRV